MNRKISLQGGRFVMSRTGSRLSGARNFQLRNCSFMYASYHCPFPDCPYFRPAKSLPMLQATVNEKFSFKIEQQDGTWLLNGQPAALDVAASTHGVLSILFGGKSYEAIVEGVDKKTKELRVSVNGQRCQVALEEPIDLLLREMGFDAAASKKAEPIKAPMPGMVLRVLVSPGQRIEKGDGVIVLEAMKMENVLKAPAAAMVKNIRVEEHTAVGKGDVLIELE
jgi:biotin carboxyl carrier protein